MTKMNYGRKTPSVRTASIYSQATSRSMANLKSLTSLKSLGEDSVVPTADSSRRVFSGHSKRIVAGRLLFVVSSNYIENGINRKLALLRIVCLDIRQALLLCTESAINRTEPGVVKTAKNANLRICYRLFLRWSLYILLSLHTFVRIRWARMNSSNVATTHSLAGSRPTTPHSHSTVSTPPAV